MTIRLVRLGALALVVAFTSAAFALEVPIRYIKHKEPSETFLPYGSARLTGLNQCPEGEWKLPELKCKHPVYALSQMGDKSRLMILDAKPGEKMYSLCYFDANGNSDLTDDPVIEGQGNLQQFYFGSHFPAVDTSIQLGDRALPFRFQPSANYYPSSINVNGPEPNSPVLNGLSDEDLANQFHFYLRVQCSYAGELNLDGKKYQIMLGDTNCTGRFNDRFTPNEYEKDLDAPEVIRGVSDTLYMAPDKDTISYNDGLDFGDRLWVDGKLFGVEVSTPDAKMTLTPITENLSPLKLSQSTLRLGMYTQDNAHCFMMVGPGTEVRVPAGTYHLLDCDLTKKDTEGDLWRIDSTATTESPFVAVDGKAEALLMFGEPYKPVVTVPPWSRDNFEKSDVPMVNLQFDIKGIGKEQVTGLSHIDGNKTKISLSNKPGNADKPKEPKYKVVKLDGEVVASGSFSYG